MIERGQNACGGYGDRHEGPRATEAERKQEASAEVNVFVLFIWSANQNHTSTGELA